MILAAAKLPFSLLNDKKYVFRTNPDFPVININLLGFFHTCNDITQHYGQVYKKRKKNKNPKPTMNNIKEQ
jgi:hypothetical protein